MKLDKRFTPVCWIVLVLFSSSLLFARYSSLATGTSSAADIVILLVWIGLVTAPVFHELDLARSSLETRVDSLKAQVQNLTSSIQTQTQSININNYPSLPKDDEIGQRRKEAAEILGKRPQERSLPEQASLPEDSGLNYLFNVRRYLELELRRITGAHFDSAWDYRRSSAASGGSTPGWRRCAGAEARATGRGCLRDLFSCRSWGRCLAKTDRLRQRNLAGSHRRAAGRAIGRSREALERDVEKRDGNLRRWPKVTFLARHA
jgi:hypothetical protein